LQLDDAIINLYVGANISILKIESKSQQDIYTFTKNKSWRKYQYFKDRKQITTVLAATADVKSLAQISVF